MESGERTFREKITAKWWHHPLLFMALAIVLWGSAFPAISIALTSYPPGELAAFRFLTASVAVAILSLKIRLQRPLMADLPRLLVAGILGIVLYTVALNTGQQTVSAASASFIIGLTPIITVVLAPWIIKESAAQAAWWGLLISFSGVSLIALGEGNLLQFEKGTLWVLAAAFFGSGNILAQKPLLQKYTGFTVSAIGIWAGALVLWILFPGWTKTMQGASMEATIAVLYLGIFPGAFAYLSWSTALASFPASRASQFLYLIPVVSLLLAFILLAELPTWLALAGGGLALTGVVLGRRTAPVSS